MFVIFSVFYILIAASMIVLILMQRGAGADAGSGFGGGASATVFGARGSSTFMTRATGVLAALFFLLSLGMGMYLSRHGAPDNGSDAGVMSGLANPPAATQNAPPAATPKAPAPVNPEVPQATTAPAATNQSEVPAAQTPAPAPAKKN
jgi:preprotein translocase subunit SecG